MGTAIAYVLSVTALTVSLYASLVANRLSPVYYRTAEGETVNKCVDRIWPPFERELICDYTWQADGTLLDSKRRLVTDPAIIERVRSYGWIYDERNRR